MNNLFLSCNGNWTLQHIAQTDCSVSILEDVQNPAGHSFEQPVPAILFWAGGLHFRIQSTPIAFWLCSICYNDGTHCFWSLWRCSVPQQNKLPLHKVRNLCNSSMVWTFPCYSSDSSDFKAQHHFEQHPLKVSTYKSHIQHKMSWIFQFIWLFLTLDTTDSCHTACLSSEQQAKYMAIRWKRRVT